MIPIGHERHASGESHHDELEAAGQEVPDTGPLDRPKPSLRSGRGGIDPTMQMVRMGRLVGWVWL